MFGPSTIADSREIHTSYDNEFFSQAYEPIFERQDHEFSNKTTSITFRETDYEIDLSQSCSSTTPGNNVMLELNGKMT